MEHRPLERKVYVTEIDDETGQVDYVEEYREVCEVCVPKYGRYKPWPCEYAPTPSPAAEQHATGTPTTPSTDNAAEDD